jgi:hypothetical protein
MTGFSRHHFPKRRRLEKFSEPLDFNSGRCAVENLEPEV